MEGRFDRFFLDMEDLHRGFRDQPCFTCRMAAGDIRFPENVILEGDETPPAGVPYGDQQGAGAGWDREVLEITRQEMSGLAGRIRRGI